MSEGLLCPNCKVDLVMSDRQGIEIDYCPKCRGVWLDRGELDKVIERSVEGVAATPQPARNQGNYPPPQDQGGLASIARKMLRDDDDDDHKYRQGYDNRGGHYGYKKKNWLKEIFD